jgi:hypothetical protein
LVYEVSQGWQPLRAFLGKEVPKNKPFPRLAAAVAWGASCAVVVLVVPGLFRQIPLMR